MKLRNSKLAYLICDVIKTFCVKGKRSMISLLVWKWLYLLAEDENRFYCCVGGTNARNCTTLHGTHFKLKYKERKRGTIKIVDIIKKKKERY